MNILRSRPVRDPLWHIVPLSLLSWILLCVFDALYCNLLHNGKPAHNQAGDILDEPFLHAAVDLRRLLRERAVDNVIVLVGFNYGYKGMFLNLMCQFGELGVENFAIAAFDVQAYAFCLVNELPCFPTIEGSFEDGSEFYGGSLPQVWGTNGFRRLTKQKSQQVLRVLQLGYDVLWTDVDVYWKQNPLPSIRMHLGEDAHVGIQTDALWGTDANSWLNSGFYYVKCSNGTLRVFADIVDDSQHSDESEQPSFNRVLCRTRKGDAECLNEQHGVLTRALDREHFVHGAINHITKDVTKDSHDDVVMVHFNYRAGRKDKELSLKENGLWMGTDCPWSEHDQNTEVMKE